MSESNATVQLLSDAPASSDAFSGGHDRVAEALADLVQSEEGGKSVALSGQYGSGKSTVIRLFEEKIGSADDDAETSIFLFDAWAHRGDPLRRTFIEKLIEHLGGTTWATKANRKLWARKADLLSGRRETTDIRKTPRLTEWGQTFAFFLLLFPFGLVLLRAAYTSNPTNTWLWWPGFVLSLLPACTVVLAYLKNKFWDEADADNSLLGVYMNQHQEVTRKETVRVPEPTSVEFEEHFADILGGLSAEGKERRLVIVFDNLDRLVSAEDTMEAWSAMRTFFDPVSRNGGPDGIQPWLIVPFAPAALEGTFRSSGENAGSRGHSKTETKENLTGEIENEKPPAKALRNAERERGAKFQAFVDKTFQIVFRVAPPVLSDWKGFLQEMLQEAFPTLSKDESFEEEAHHIYRFYQVLRVAGQKPPTPRDLKVFINQLGGLHRQWGRKISLSMLALYLLVQDRISPSAEELIKSGPEGAGFLEEAVRSHVPVGGPAQLARKDWRHQLAGIHFNVDVERASEVLLGDRISEALLNGAQDGLQDLEETPGFYENVAREVTKITQRKNAREIAMSARALGGVEKVQNQSYKEAWEALRSTATLIQDWKPDEKAIGEGAAELMKYTQSLNDTEKRVELCDNLIRHLTPSALGVSDEDDEDLIATPSWVEAVAPVVLELKRQGYTRQVSDGEASTINSVFKIPDDPKATIEVFETLSEREDGSDLATYFLLRADKAEVVSALNDYCSSGKLDFLHAYAIKLLYESTPAKSKKAWNWAPLCNQIKSRLQVSNTIDDREAAAAAKILLVLTDIEDEAKTVADNLAKGPFQHHFYSAKGNVEYETPILLLVLRFNDEVDLPTNISNSGNTKRGANAIENLFADLDEHPDRVEKITDLVTELNQVWDLPLHLTSNYESTKTRKAIKVVLRKVAEREDRTKHFTADRLLTVEYYPEIRAVLGTETRRSIIRELLSKEKIAEALEEEDTFETMPSGAYEDLKDLCEPEEWERHLDLIRESVQKVGKDYWQRQLKSERWVVDLLLVMVEEGESPLLGTPFNDALDGHFRSMREGETSVDEHQERWCELPEALDEDNRATLRRNLCDYLIDRPEEDLVAVISAYGKFMLSADTWRSRSDRAVRHLFKRIVQEGQVPTINWLADLSEVHPNLFGGLSDETRQTFNGHLVASYKEEGTVEAAKNALERIGEASGADFPEEKEDEEQEDTDATEEQE